VTNGSGVGGVVHYKIKTVYLLENHSYTMTLWFNEEYISSQFEEIESLDSESLKIEQKPTEGDNLSYSVFLEEVSLNSYHFSRIANYVDSINGEVEIKSANDGIHLVFTAHERYHIKK